jgi:hypothetical protein
MFRIRLQLAANASDEGPNIIHLLPVLATPHALEDLTVQLHLPGVAG